METRPSGTKRRTLLWIGAAGVIALALAVTLGVRQPASGPAPSRTIAVLVPEPRIASSPEDERSRFAAFALREAALRTLAELDGIEPIGPDELPEGTLTAQSAARAVAADEVVFSTIACQGQWCRVSLRRERASDGHVLSGSGSFDVSDDSEASLELANAIAIHVRQAFPEHLTRSSSERVDVRSADYHLYLSMLRRTEVGDVLGRPEIGELERIARASPGLTEAYVLATGTARALPDRALAERMLREAERVIREIRAWSTSASCSRWMPGRSPTRRRRSRSWSGGRPAMSACGGPGPGSSAAWAGSRRWRKCAGRWCATGPRGRTSGTSRTSRSSSADASAAREHLERLLEISPGNERGQAKAAELEWLMGDPAKAVRIYEGLLERKLTWENLSNLGWSLLLAGEYATAAARLKQALDLAPDDLVSRMNLGIAEEGTGDAQAAHARYREVLQGIAQRERNAALTVSERLIKAQAMARLGDRLPAIELTIGSPGRARPGLAGRVPGRDRLCALRRAEPCDRAGARSTPARPLREVVHDSGLRIASPAARLPDGSRAGVT